MKILFCVTNFGFLRNFQSTIGMLAERGHRIHLVADRTDSTGGMRMVEALIAAHPAITYEVSPPVKRGLWFAFSSLTRLTLDYWRYLEPRFASAVQLRARAEQYVPAVSRWLGTWPVLRSAPCRRLLTALLKRAERVIPIRPEVMALVKREAPDLVLLTPLLYFGSRQVEHVRAARVLGIPTLLGVGSWDHLTTKGRIHELPDYVAVWNEFQRDEARELHGVPPDRVIVTGAQAYDHWFDRSASTARDVFCQRTGISADRPYLLYLCSSPFITPHEVGFIRRWIEAIRAHASPFVSNVGILIRPHPQNAEQWADVDLAPLGNVAIWPRAGANPIDAAAKSDYFDSIFHSHAVVGINTSGLIESGIIGRRVYSIAAAEFATTQEGTLHFQHLKNVEGGLLRMAASFDEHLRQLAPTLETTAPPGDDAKVRGFVKAFVRPYGLEQPATPRMAGAVEWAAAQRVSPRPEPMLRRAGRGLMVPVAFALMVANVERDRWRSWAIRGTSPVRRLARSCWKVIYPSQRTARRRVRVAASTLRTFMRGRARAVRRIVRGAPYAE